MSDEQIAGLTEPIGVLVPEGSIVVDRARFERLIAFGQAAAEAIDVANLAVYRAKQALQAGDFVP